MLRELLLNEFFSVVLFPWKIIRSKEKQKFDSGLVFICLTLKGCVLLRKGFIYSVEFIDLYSHYQFDIFFKSLAKPCKSRIFPSSSKTLFK